MGDFLVDFRPRAERKLRSAAAFLKFYDDVLVHLFENDDFGLLLTSVDDPDLWGPCASTDGSLLVALSGRVALEEKQWGEAKRIDGPGGLACKFIGQSYRQKGLPALEELNGNFVILLYDRNQSRLFIITDRWGIFPAFRIGDGSSKLVFSSHPDVLADAIDESRNWDLTSFAEFILAGRLSYPFTYYKRIKALPFANTTTVSLSGARPEIESSRNYFDFESCPQPDEKLEEFAEALAEAFKKSVSKRTLPILGRSAVALSGGLDSRTVLCASPNQRQVVTFSCYDEENREFRIARAVARDAGAEFIPFKRSFDYYADHAALGIKISAGMGCIASNHFLGFREELRGLGIDNILTGCYCDYVFKGLALNKNLNRMTTRESVGRFDHAYYAPFFRSETELGRAVRQRLDTVYPESLRLAPSEQSTLGIEKLRIFPLSYEADSAGRIIPQHVLGWFVPIAENAMLDIYLKMSFPMKLNRRLFARVTEILCGGPVARIPEANTGARVNAPWFVEAAHCHFQLAERLVRKLRRATVTSGSWPNWIEYPRQSRRIKLLWDSPNADAKEIFRQVLGERFSSDVAAYHGREVYLFLQLFTLKLWFDQRL